MFLQTKDLHFLKGLQEQMLWEDKYDNDIQANPRFWVIRDYYTVPTIEGHHDRIIHYYNDGDIIEFDESNVKDLQEFIAEHYSDIVEESDNVDYIENTDLSFHTVWEWAVNDIINEDGHFTKIPVKDVPYIIPNTLFLTKKDAKEYLQKFSYNHSFRAHTYAMTALRSTSVEKLFSIIHESNFDFTDVLKDKIKDIQSKSDLAKVTYAFGLLDNQIDLDWGEIEEYSQTILDDWKEFKDIQTNEEEGYLIPYAIRRWEDKIKELKIEK